VQGYNPAGGGLVILSEAALGDDLDTFSKSSGTKGAEDLLQGAP
jgi:hypothetical protein